MYNGYNQGHSQLEDNSGGERTTDNTCERILLSVTNLYDHHHQSEGVRDPQAGATGGAGVYDLQGASREIVQESLPMQEAPRS